MAFIDVGLPTRIKATAPDTPPQMPDDGYPAIFHDQRTMLTNGDECETGEDVFWKCWVPHLARYKNMEPLPDPREVIPYLNAGRWVTDCPECHGGIACWDRNPYACCLGCGHMFEVTWQLPALRSEVMRLLAGRPEAHRNWDVGETVEELKIQNVLMLGVPSAERNGLLVADNVHVPDEFLSPSEYLNHLSNARRV